VPPHTLGHLCGGDAPTWYTGVPHTPAGHHLLRRGAVYYWRKRLTTAGVHTTIFQVSLQTTEKGLARRLAARLTFMSEILAPELGGGRLSPDAVKAILREVARRQAAHLEHRALVDRTDVSPDSIAGEWRERVTGTAWRLLAERGRGATVPADPDYMEECGLDPAESGLVDVLLDNFRTRDVVPPAPETLKDLIQRHAPGAAVGPLTLGEAEHAFYRGMAAAYLHAEPRWGCTLDKDIGLAFGETEAADSAAPNAFTAGHGLAVPAIPAAIAQPGCIFQPAAPAEQAAGGHGSPSSSEPTIGALSERFGAMKIQLGEWSPKTARQAAQSAALLVKVVGHDRFTRLTQADMGKYVDVLLAVPKTYGKSPRDAECSVEAILERAARLPPAERGLSGSTINRHLTQLGELIAYAASVACILPLRFH